MEPTSDEVEEEKSVDNDSPRQNDSSDQVPFIRVPSRFSPSQLPTPNRTPRLHHRPSPIRSPAKPLIPKNRPHSAPPSKSSSGVLTDHRKGNKVVSKEEFKDTLTRFEAYELNKIKKKESRRLEVANSEVKELRAVPQIDPHSKKLIRNQEDLIQRMFILLEETLKKRKIAKEQHDIALTKSLKSPEILPQSKELKRGTNLIAEWNEQKVRRLKEERERKVLLEEKSLQKYFKPQINQKSLQILEKKKASKDVNERMEIDMQKREQKAGLAKKKETEELFHPQINSRSKSIKQDKPVFDRLYNDGIRVMMAKQKLIVDQWDNAWDVQKPKTLVEPLSRLTQNFSTEDIEQGINSLQSDLESAMEEEDLFVHSHGVGHAQTPKPTTVNTSTTNQGPATPFDLRRVMLDTYYGYTQQKPEPQPMMHLKEEASRRRLSLN